jgi:pimeloyl-ACP methyl ester carboxylesterase
MATAEPDTAKEAGYRPRRLGRQELLRVRGARIAVTRWGPDAAPIVLLHGAMDCGASFQLLADALPGVGRSRRSAGALRRQRARVDGYLFTHNLGDSTRCWAISPAPGAGGNLGGVTATYAGVRRSASPGWGPRFGLKGPCPSRRRVTPHNYGPAPAARRARAAHLSSLDLVARIVKRNPHHLSAPASSPGVEPTRARRRPELRADPLHRLLTPILTRPEEFAACWGHLRCPALLGSGLESELLRRLGHAGSVDRWRHLVPASAVAPIAGAGHMLHVEQSETCARAIMDFVRGLA